MKTTFDKLDELTIKGSNELPNLNEFIANAFLPGDFAVFRKQWGRHTTHSSERLFSHELGTLLLNAKLYSNVNMFGMRYGNMCAVTYVNACSPNLLEFYVCI